MTLRRIRDTWGSITRSLHVSWDAAYQVNGSGFGAKGFPRVFVSLLCLIDWFCCIVSSFFGVCFIVSLCAVLSAHARPPTYLLVGPRLSFSDIWSRIAR